MPNTCTMERCTASCLRIPRKSLEPMRRSVTRSHGWSLEPSATPKARTAVCLDYQLSGCSSSAPRALAVVSTPSMLPNRLCRLVYGTLHTHFGGKPAGRTDPAPPLMTEM